MTTRFLSQPLSQAAAGDQFWFLYTDADTRGGSPLLIGPLDTDPAMPNLRALVEAFALPAGTAIVQGRATVADDGVVEFASHEVSERMLHRFSAWVCANVGADPELSRFAGARFVRTSRGARRAVEACLEDAAAWGGLQPPVVSGTMAATLQRLGALKRGQRAWFWLTAQGPGSRPFLHLSLEAEDPDCQRFRAEVDALRQRGSLGADSAFGVLIRTRFLYTFTTNEPVADWSGLMQGLVDAWGASHPAVLGLTATPLTRLRSGRIAQLVDTAVTLPDSPDNLLREVGILKRTRGDEVAWFWLTDADQSGLPRLCMAPGREALRVAVRPFRGGASMRGTVQIGASGKIELRTRGLIDAPFDALDGFIARYQPGWPILRMLRGATIIQQDESGAVIARHTHPGRKP